MKFLKVFAATLVVLFVFVFFGGWQLLNFTKHFYIAVVSCALIAALLLYCLLVMSDKIEQLQKRVRDLEEQTKKDDTEA